MFTVIISLGSVPARALKTPTDDLVTAINRFDQADVVGAYDDEHARVVQTLIWNTPESKLEAVPHVCPFSGRVITAWVRLDNRDALFDEFDTPAEHRNTTTDPMLLLSAYDRWGRQCVQHLLGDFSFVIYDPADRTVFAARDPLGVKPLYYHTDRQGDENVVVFSTTAATFHTIEGLELIPSEEWMALYVISQSKSHVATAWPNVQKLPGGHRLTVGVGGEGPTVQRYHSFRDDPPVTFARDDVWVERYRTVLEESVRCRLRTEFPMGVESSGGIDSSTCVGYTAKLWERTPDEIHTFGFLHNVYEPDFILETSKLHGLESNHIHPPRTGFDPTETRDRSLALLGYPAEHGNAPAHEPFYAECEELDVRTLLSGFGGDEVVTNQAELLARELIDHRRFVLLYKHLHGRRLLKPLHFVRAVQRHRRGSKVASRMVSAGRDNIQHLALTAEVVERYGLREHFLEQWKFDDEYRTINGFALGNRLSAPFVPSRLENCTVMAQARGVDYRWPLLDVRLIQQYLSSPAIEKRGSGIGRYLHRRAIAGVVPEKVRWKLSKYMGDPIHERGDRRTAELVADLVADLHPRLEPLIDREELTRTVARDDHQFLHRQVYHLTTLNAWLHRCHPAC